jgi:hypothetical protein
LTNNKKSKTFKCRLDYPFKLKTLRAKSLFNFLFPIIWVIFFIIFILICIFLNGRVIFSVGLVIGKNGETIKLINQRSGAYVFIPPESSPNDI